MTSNKIKEVQHVSKLRTTAKMKSHPRACRVCGKVVALGKGVVVEFGAGGMEHKTCEKRRENPAVDQHQPYTTTVRHGGDKRRVYKTRTTGVPKATNT